ncbi:uncharacterized protein [Arachis hypogaea]|uniref:Transposase, Ptta/En/Spm, plant n=1 Tax=Arachis hypogaea TaxID=3818 RepID=A0A444Z5W4_ARAHY|nr:uncharacterized protein LOC112750170 [Arachis hypogaea]XP_025654539.1 uncharacterized protein LOC112750170 [Arachis hypogaea]XP_025654540.1 uncharacterized protein LOC112750170 [Arachis hypogaea]XP_029148703.1 uncharacterized protein LOC112750170 [Arachis hypogaea]RYR09564.1 hypothetical protein Ahy_B05g077929 [Arachis hypogaea]
MPRVGRFMKKARVDIACQQPQVGGHAASTSQGADCPIPPPIGSSAPTSSSLRPFRPPRTEPLPAPHASMNDVENSEPDAEADEVDSFDQHVDNLLAAQDAQKRKGRKTTEFWDVKTIESDGTIKQVKLSVKEAMKPPNGRKVVLRFNSALQPVGDEAGLLSGVMGLLGSDYTKFPIGERDWRKVRTRDKVYNEIVKEMFHFEEDSRGIIKSVIFKMLGRAWKETRSRLYHRYYDAELSLAENIENRPDGITAEHWRKFLDYRNSEETQEKCKKNAENRSKQLYTHTGGSKSLARLGEEESERQGRRVSRGELYLLTHKRDDGSYIHDAARAIGERIEAIEQGDESSRLLSQNDSLAQALGKEHPGRVRGMGLGPTSSQVFGMNSHQPNNSFEREETQRVLLELQAELAAEKLKRKAVENEVAAEKTRRQAVEDEVAAGKVRMQAMESALICLLQGQGRELPSDVATWMSALEGQIRK